MRDIDTVFDALSHSNFRMRFRLGAREETYLREHGMTEVISHAGELITRRLAPEHLPNDGKQTPFAVIRYLSRSMPRQRAVGVASQNGTASRRENC